ncbi:MAG: hypothetical protein ABI769_18670 [Pseudomonadota bacterium]
MRKALVGGGIAVVAVFAGVLYFARDPAPPSTAADQRSVNEVAPAPAVTPTPAPPGSRSAAPPRPVPADPRLAALMVSPDNALMEFVAGDNGKVIKEIDNDPNSAGYRKSLREYTYVGDKVILLTAYRYLGDQVQVIKAAVTYKPDGSVDQYQESTSYQQAADAKGQN